jgi:ectoine hydroxylase
MLVIPGSHKEMIDVEAQEVEALGSVAPRVAEGDGAGSWIHTLTANLKYKINRKILAGLLTKNSIYAAKGRAGFVLFFHGNLFHASSNNLSPYDRMSIFVTYNSSENCLHDMKKPRPTFIADRDYTPIMTVSDDALLRMRTNGHA